MSLNKTIKLIVFYAVIIAIICLVVFCLIRIYTNEAYALHGVAVEIHYNPARELICPPFDEEFRANATVLIDQIYVTIPDMPNKRNHLYYYVSPIRNGYLDHTILLPIEKANEILELIGEDPIPPWIQFWDKFL